MLEIFHINKYFIFYKFIKFNMVICMKVTGETFSFLQREKRSGGIKCEVVKPGKYLFTQ